MMHFLKNQDSFHQQILLPSHLIIIFIFNWQIGLFWQMANYELHAYSIQIAMYLNR